MAVVRKTTGVAVKAGKASTARKPATAKKTVKKAKTAKSVPTPSTSDGTKVSILEKRTTKRCQI